MLGNLLLRTDSYKVGHHKMYPEGTEKVYSYFESRPGAQFPETVFFGLQMLLKRYLLGQVVTSQDITEAESFCRAHFGYDFFNMPMWLHILGKHGGKLPLSIKAVPEGTPVPVGNVLMTVENTDEQCFALTNYLETLLTHVWYPSNVATISWTLKKSMQSAFEKASDHPEMLDFLLHDFGFRGTSSVESAGMGGCAHLTQFKGTDTLEGIVYAKEYYGAGMPGLSVAASEHSVMTSLGPRGEMEMVRRLCKQYPEGILSVVSDSYSITEAVKHYCTDLKNAILARNGKFVVRPDSPRYPEEPPQYQILWIARQLAEYFGSHQNSKGYTELHSKVGIIYGDGLTEDQIRTCLWALLDEGFAPETCVYGMGGGLLQKHNRDTQRSAFKCSAQQRGGVWYDISKTPLDATKKSKLGRLKLIHSGSSWNTVSESQALEEPDQLVEVYRDGKLLVDWNWEDVLQHST